MDTTLWSTTSTEVSRIGFGTWSHGGPREVDGNAVGWSGQDDTRSREALITAFAQGITHWDTADIYGDGHSERLIGQVWSRVQREQVFLASKVGWDPGPYDHYYEPEYMREKLEASLTSLGTEVIDLYYLHHCDFGPEDRYFDGAVEQVERFREEGKVRFLGLSDWDCEKIAHFAPRMDPDVVQPYRNVLDDRYEASGLKAWVEDSGAGVAFFSPLKHGLLLGKYEEPAEFPEGDMRRRIPEFRDRQALARFRRARRAIEERFSDHPQPVLHAVTGALLADAPQGVVLLGLRNPAQAEAAGSLGTPLSAEDAAWVRALFRGTT